MELDAKAWQAFVVIAEHGSISKAAKELACSHSTLSRQIACLEDNLGYELFTRSGTGKKLTITEEGQRLKSKASIAVQTFDELNSQAMSFFDTKTPQSIVFAIPDILSPIIETRLAAAIWDKWPYIELTFMKPSLFEGLSLCAQQKVDFAIICHESKRLTAVRTEVIGEVSLQIVVSPEHPLALESKELGIESLTPYRLFYPLVNRSGLSLLEDDRFSINSCYVQQLGQGVEMAKQGLGVAFAPEHLVLPYIKTKELKYLNLFSSRLSLKVKLELSYLNSYPFKSISDFILRTLLKLMHDIE